MSSCCRASQKDPNLEFFDVVDKLSAALSNREEQDLKDDAESNIRWPKYQRLMQLLKQVEATTGKKL